MTGEPGTDVLVVGAGIIGAACAYHLAAAGRAVTVVDAFDGPAEGSSGRSFASIRGQWADPLNIEMSWRSICRYRDFEATHGVDVGYRPSGYLLLVPRDAWPGHLEAVELQRRHGVPVEVLDPDAAAAITPLVAEGIAGATWGPADGVVDPPTVTSAFLAMAAAHGATTRFGYRVLGIDPDPATGGWIVSGPPGRATICSQYLVDAAGGWAGELAALAGLDVPVVHSRRNIYSSAPGALSRTLPMTVDLSTGVYLRSEGSRLLIGLARPDQPDGYDVSVDWPWMESVIATGMSRFPWLADLPLDRSGAWAGTYENSPDHHGLLGPDATASTWINACGFSGRGVMQAPEIGRLVAEQIVTGAITSLDASPLRPDRFQARAQGAARAGMVF
jgi:sarcosine oxidase subunit beta